MLLNLLQEKLKLMSSLLSSSAKEKRLLNQKADQVAYPQSLLGTPKNSKDLSAKKYLTKPQPGIR